MALFRIAGPLLVFSLILLPMRAQAAESYENCTGFVTTIPTTITTQGTWCLSADVTTAITAGDAVTIATNNVTLDCNDFKIGGLAAGAGTTARGVYAESRTNATIRNCNIRGFQLGINLQGTGSSGHLVENNRLDGNTQTGISVRGDGSTVRGNRVFDTGGSTFDDVNLHTAFGIVAVGTVDILDNTISGVTAAAGTNGLAYGISTNANLQGSIKGNRVRALVPAGIGNGRGIFNSNSDRVIIRDNDLSEGGAISTAIRCTGATGLARDNVVSGFQTALLSCTDGGGNTFLPNL